MPCFDVVRGSADGNSAETEMQSAAVSEMKKVRFYYIYKYFIFLLLYYTSTKFVLENMIFCIENRSWK